MDQLSMTEKTKRQIEINQELEESNLIKAKYLEDKETNK